MFEVGLSTCGKEICEELFKKYNDAQITHMEVSADADTYKDLDYAALGEYAKRYNVCLWSFHLPFSPFDKIELSVRSICRQTTDYYEELIKRAANIGVDKFVVHASGEPIEDRDRRDRLECAKESLFRLAEAAKRQNAVIAVEDLPRSCIGKNSDEIAELICVHDRLKVCFDTNHLLSEDLCDFVHKIGSRIITTHISDYDFVDERHWLPGEGKIDWKQLIGAFKDINYNGVWMYELGFETPRTITRSRDLVCGDFVKNAKELFEAADIFGEVAK